eukprot:CAMPEP_0168513454 /NCGR_PEP_ID=MMETSP0405-20121227/3469_1 /TAXON_ID=498012 /ORGANISM="Trichosphaerium sp, Strain Am-I-7 wt" /LENGTH=96 /DNA_ID=CAMNT_0008532283 /DNA_START=105 /DNA_END=391 /DNA_ORIENTATION=-
MDNKLLAPYYGLTIAAFFAGLFYLLLALTSKPYFVPFVVFFSMLAAIFASCVAYEKGVLCFSNSFIKCDDGGKLLFSGAVITIVFSIVSAMSLSVP